MKKEKKKLYHIVCGILMLVYGALLFFAPLFFFDVKVGAKDFDYMVSYIQAIFTPVKTIVSYRFIVDLSLWSILGVALTVLSLWLIAYRREGGRLFLIIGCIIFFVTVFMARGSVKAAGWSRLEADAFYSFGILLFAAFYVLVFVYTFVIAAVEKKIAARRWYLEHIDQMYQTDSAATSPAEEKGQ